MLLTLELLPLILDTAASSGDGRVIFVSSVSHSLAPSFNVSKMDATEAEYGRLEAYNRSKLYNVWTLYHGIKIGSMIIASVLRETIAKVFSVDSFAWP